MNVLLWGPIDWVEDKIIDILYNIATTWANNIYGDSQLDSLVQYLFLSKGREGSFGYIYWDVINTIYDVVVPFGLPLIATFFLLI